MATVAYLARVVLFAGVLSPVCAQHPVHDKVCLLCNASFFCTGNLRHRCPSNSLAEEFASEISECVCLHGYNRTGDVCESGNPPFYYQDGVTFKCSTHKQTVVDRATSASDCVCEPGFVYRGDLGNAYTAPCQKCRFGQFADKFNTSACHSCPANSFHEKLHVSDVHECICVPGFTGPDGGPCVACADGLFKAANGSHACEPCAENTFSDGQGAVTCSACPLNSKAPSSSAFIADCACDAGYERIGDECRACAAGKFKALPGNTLCEVCAANTFTNVTAQTACVDCLADSHAVTARDACKCNAGFTQTSPDLDQPACTACAPDLYQHNVGATACFDCPEHSTSPAASAHLDDCICVPGYVETDLLLGECEACAPGKYERLQDLPHGHDDERGVCEACPVDSHSPVASDAVTDCICNAGFDGPDGGPCTACAPGTFKAVNGSEACADCAPNTYADGAASTVCTDCVPFALSPAGSDAESDCDCDKQNGYSTLFRDGIRECTPCAAGTFVVDTGGCQNCSIGFFANAGGLTTCTECAANTTSTYQIGGFVECVCVRGHSCRQTETCDNDCVACPADTYKDTIAYAPACDACPPNSQSYPASIQREDCRCNAGFAGPDGGNCSACVAGTFSPYAGEPACTACPVWHYTPVQLYPYDDADDCYACDDCSLSEFDSARGGLGCGESSPTFCQACPANSAQHATNAHGGVTGLGVQSCSCNVGFHGPLGGPCAVCPAGSVKLERLHVDSSSDDCQVCAAGTFARTPAEACVPCLENASSAPGAVDCFCNAGFTGDTLDNGASCTACAPGTFKNETGTAACVDCAADFFQASSAATVCAACAPHASSTTGQAFCQCDAGYTGANGDGSACALCVDGKFKTSSGPQECSTCATCDYNEQVLTECSPYADITCQACQANSHDDHRTTLGPCLCNAGYELVDVACVACSPGFYKTTDLNNSVPCQVCPPLTFTPDFATAECTDCQRSCADTADSPGQRFYVTKECNTTHDIVCEACTVCPPGFYANNTCGTHYGNDRLDTQCVECPSGAYCPGADAGILTCPADSDSVAGSDAREDCYCNAGFYNSFDDSSVAPDLSTTATCRRCEADTYCVGDGVPRDCPEFSFTRRTHLTKRLDCQCLNGHYRLGKDDAFECPLCRENDYCFNNSQYNCSDPRMTAEVGSDAHEDCVCLPGFYNNGTRCEVCPRNHFCPGDKLFHACAENEWTAGRTGDARCVCEPTFFRTAPDLACQPCRDNFYCPGDADAIQPCPTNSTASSASVVTQCLCDPGFQNITAHSANGTAHACVPCPHKTFKPLSGNEQCAPCFVCLPSNGVYELQACRTTHDSLCSPCDTCTAGGDRGEFTDVPCALTADAVCEPCTECNYALEYLETLCTPQHDAVCLNITYDRQCAVNQYAGGHTLREDSRCLACAYRDLPYFGQRLHVAISPGQTYNDPYSCRVRCLGNSVFRDPSNHSLGCRTCENGNVLLRTPVLDPVQEVCNFTCLSGYEYDSVADDCFVGRLQASADNSFSHSVDVTAFDYTPQGLRFRVQHSNHSRYVVVAGPRAVQSEECRNGSRTDIGCCWQGQYRVSTLAQAAAEIDRCSAQPPLHALAVSGNQIEFFIPETRLSEIANCTFAGLEYKCFLHVSLVDIVLQRAISTSVQITSIRGDTLAFIRRTHYIPLTQFQVIAMRAYDNVYQVIVSATSDSAMTLVVRAPALSAVNASEAGARCSRTTASGADGTDSVQLAPGITAAMTSYWRAPENAQTLVLLFNLRDASGSVMMDIGAVRNVTGQTPVCDQAAVELPEQHAFSLGTVASAVGFGSHAVAKLRVGATQSVPLTHGPLGALITFVAYSFAPEVTSVSVTSLLSAHVTQTDESAFIARLHNATSISNGELQFEYDFRTWCRAHGCAYEYLHIDTRNRGFYTVDCNSGRALARAWIINTLGAVHDDGHVDAACTSAAALAHGRAFAVVLVNSMPYVPINIRSHATRTAAWSAFDFKV